PGAGARRTALRPPCTCPPTTAGTRAFTFAFVLGPERAPPHAPTAKHPAPDRAVAPPYPPGARGRTGNGGKSGGARSGAALHARLPRVLRADSAGAVGVIVRRPPKKDLDERAYFQGVRHPRPGR